MIRQLPECTDIPLLLAPMAGITHAGFRVMIGEYGGCDLLFSEMISAEALIHGSPYEHAYLDGAPDPTRLVYQLVGHSQEAICRAAERVCRQPSFGIDINMGCSAPAVVRRGGGVAWMQDPETALRLVRAVRHVAADRCLSVKLRLGEHEAPEALVSFCTRLADAGLDFLTLHPKTRKDGPHRPAQWKYARHLAEALPIPVVGNGGVNDAASFGARRAEYPYGGIMIGRAAVQAPWIFAGLKGDREWTIDPAHVVGRFHELLERHQPVDFWSTRARRFYPYFFRNFPFGHSMGARLGNLRDYNQIKREALDYFATREDLTLSVAASHLAAPGSDAGSTDKTGVAVGQ